MATVRLFNVTIRKFKFLFPRTHTNFQILPYRHFSALSHEEPVIEKGSIPHYEHILSQNPDDPQNISNLAMEYFLNDDLDRANQLYVDSLSRHQTNGDLHFYYAHFLFHCMKDLDLSKQYALSSVECNNVSPPLSSPFILLAQIYGMQHDMEEAQKYLQIAINEIGDDECNAYFNWAQTLNMLQRYSECIEYLHLTMDHLEEDNEYHPTKEQVYLLMVSCFTELKDYENAIRCTKKLSDQSAIAENLRLLHEYLNHQSSSTHSTVDDQEQFYVDELVENPLDFYSNIYYAKWLISKDRGSESIEFLDKAMDIEPDHFEPFYFKALALYFGQNNSGRSAESENAVDDKTEIICLWEKVMEMEPLEMNCYVYLARIYVDDGDLEMALKVMENGFAVYEGNGDDVEPSNLLWFNYALILQELNRMEVYQEAMRRTIDICKEYSNHRHNSNERESEQRINPQLFYKRNGIFNVNNHIHSRIEVLRIFGDFYISLDQRVKALRCYLQALDEVEQFRDKRLEEEVLITVATVYSEMKGEEENMRRYIMIGLNKYPKSARLNFLYSQYLFQHEQSYVLAIKYLDIVLAMEPENMELYLIKANIYHNRMYEHQNAVECLHRVMYLTDTHHPVHIQAKELLEQITVPTWRPRTR